MIFRVIGMKFCTYCNTFYPVPAPGESNEFWIWRKNKGLPNGGFHRCIKHTREYQRNYRRSKNGWARTTYLQQIHSSRQRGHPPPNYSLEEFMEWAFNNPNFDRLYSSWAESGFQTNMRPSPDRLDNNKPYTFDNLRLVTFRENYCTRR